MIGRVVAVLAVGAIGTLSIAPTPAQAETGYSGPCTDNVGVTVVVDFQELGGGVNMRCAPGPVATGLDAFDRAGIAWESTRRFAGFVCRIAGRPGADTEPCGNTPPATAYWGYWIAPRGGPWCYSTLGPGSRKPPPGSIEGWSFALNKIGGTTPPPGLAPPARIAGEAPNPLSTADCGTPAEPAPAPTTAATPAPTTATTPTSQAGAAQTAVAPPAAVSSPPADTEQPSAAIGTPRSAATPTTVPAESAPSTAAGESAASGATSTTSTTSTVATTTTSSPASTTKLTTTAVVLGNVDLSDDRRSGGGPGPSTVIGAAAAIGLAGAGVWAARRRRAMP